MILKYRTGLVFKISVLLFVIALMSVLTFCVTYGRFLTQTNRDIGFSAKPLAPIYYETSQISDRTSFELSNWTQTTNLLSGNFTLSNTLNDGEVPLEDAAFCVRIYVAEQDSGGYIDITSADVTLSTDQKTCFSKVETINQNTDFYKENEKEGRFYCFYDSNEDKTTSNESMFILKGNQKSELTFTVSIFDTEVGTEQIYICIKRL